MKQSHGSPAVFVAAATWALAAGCGRIGYEETQQVPSSSSIDGDADGSGDADGPGAWLPESGLSDEAASPMIDTGSVDAAPTESGPPESGPVDAGPAEADAAPSNPGFYVETETGLLSGGFTVEFDRTASGGRFIQPPSGMTSMSQPGSALALYNVTIPNAGTYVIWGRIHSPDPLHNTFWIRVDSGVWHLWRISTGDVWYWNAFHDNFDYYHDLTFDLSAGPHQLFIASAVDGVGLDRLYFTSNGDMPPGNNTICSPPDSIEVRGMCQSSCGSQGGNACGDAMCMGYPLIPAYDCPVCCAR